MIVRPVFEDYPPTIQGNYPSSRLSQDRTDHDKHLVVRENPDRPGRFQRKGKSEHEVLGRLWTGDWPMGDWTECKKCAKLFIWCIQSLTFIMIQSINQSINQSKACPTLQFIRFAARWIPPTIDTPQTTSWVDEIQVLAINSWSTLFNYILLACNHTNRSIQLIPLITVITNLIHSLSSHLAVTWQSLTLNWCNSINPFAKL